MITKDNFNLLFPAKGLNPQKYNLVRERTRLIAALNSILPKYEINTHKRICAFFGNCGIETDYFKTTKEYASGWDYDVSVNPKKARGLGNTVKGDGPKYKGSGLTQTTGKNNFIAVQKTVGKLLGVDVVKNPELLRDNIELAVESACIFWQQNNLNYYADRLLFKNLSAIVNRGDNDKTPLHWEKRNELYLKCLRSIPKDFTIDQPVATSNEVENPATVVLTPTAPENNSPESLAVPPAPTANESQSAEAAGEQKLDKSKVKEFGEKFLKHCKNDSVKNILLVIVTRILATIGTIWKLGLHGKILLIVAAVVIIFFTARAVYIYAPRLIGWGKDLLGHFFGD